MVKRRLRAAAATAPLLLLAALLAPAASAQIDGPRLPGITSPDAFLGFELGSDYQLANYQELVAYWQRLDEESDRMALRSIGETAEGRPQFQAILTAPGNHADLDRYREIARRLAKAEGVTEAEAEELAREGKAVVWIDGGLHATEVLGAQQLMQLVYDMVSLDDAETRRFLDDVILLATHANPDGHDLVADWYMREDDPEARSTRGIPVLYEKYAGHDNNRDFFMVNLPETRNMNRVAYTEWYPQIVYNHHQTGPSGTIMFAPPFRDPPNHNLDPMILTSLDQVGSAMHHRFVREGKGGTTMRSGASYSTWWNGGLRTTPYFHNMIGLLTETQGHPTPITIDFLPDRQITHSDLPLPVEPGVWHFKQSVDYSQTANRAVLDYASRNKDLLLFNIWRMGMNSIERGSRDSWTVLPREIYAAEDSLDGGDGTREEWERLLRAPEDRDARGYILPSDQPDFNTAIDFVNALLMNGVDVERATDAFTVEGTRYPTGSLVVKTAQAFRPHVLDMFEPQDHPDDFAYPGAPPTPPYDATGWTLAYQMGVEFDRVLDGFDGPFERVDVFRLEPGPGVVAGAADAAGWLLDHRVNDAFTAVNRILAAGGQVYWMEEPVDAGGTMLPAGAFWVPASGTDRAEADALARDVGVDFHGTAERPGGQAMELRPVRVGLWDQYGGSMPSGWMRYILEDFEFDFEQVFPPELDAGDLGASYDVLLFPSGAIPGLGGDQRFGGPGADEDFLAGIPEEYRDRVGSVTAETTVPNILDFLREGGTVVTVGSSTRLGQHAGLPVGDHLVDDDGEELPRTEYYVPGTILDVKLEPVSPVTHGLGDRIDVLFDDSPVFSVEPGAEGIRRVGWFDSATPLRSGWAWGQEHLEGGAALLEADVGQGKLFLFGPEVTFRAQPHGTFPLVFNAIYYGTARSRGPITED